MNPERLFPQGIQWSTKVKRKSKEVNVEEEEMQEKSIIKKKIIIPKEEKVGKSKDLRPDLSWDCRKRYKSEAGSLCKCGP